MGIVFLARDVALERPVAIKVLAPAMAARREMRERFLREARIAAQCFHPHIVPIHAVEEADDLAWIVMAYVRGETLAERLRRNGPLAPDELRQLAREVGWALAYAHQRGVVHRDIKPENLLIDASTGRYVIADFGIAQASDAANTPVGGAIPGTARYMAPEQALGESIDGRADLYALGVTLFLAATGRAPFEGTSAVALVAQHAMQPAPSVRLFAPTLPLPLARAIDRCLAKQPDDRFADAGAFLAAVEPDVREQPLAATLLPVRDHAAAARSLLGWSVAVGVTSLLLVLGEEPRSLGRAILTPLTEAVVAVMAAAAAMRAGEALLEARRLLRAGQRPDDVARALTGEARHDSTATQRGGVISGALQIGAGMALAYAQGWLTAQTSTDAIEWIIQVVSVFGPPLLIARGASQVAGRSGIRRWLRERVTAPIARGITRLFSRRDATRAEPVSLVDAPTEVLLVQAVESAVQALPAANRHAVGDADAIARALGQQAAALRAQGLDLDAREAQALALRDDARRAAQLEAVRTERESVAQRLTTTMAALESLRLDVLLMSAERTPGGLTSELEQVRDVQRRVDAALDVRRLLRDATPV